MSARRTERLLNLVICLLSTRRVLSAQQIREMVPGYGPEDDEAFRRMFERDKEELRDLGIPLEVGSDSVWEDEQGYRIAARDYELPDIALTADEAAAVGLAARLWAQAGLAEAATSALMKLRAAGIEADTSGLGELEPHVEASEPGVRPAARRPARRQGGQLRLPAGPAAPVTKRTLDAWGVVSWRGRWYVVGHDRDREAVRVFRLSRIVGRVRTIGPVTTTSARRTSTCAASWRPRVRRAEPPSASATGRAATRRGDPAPAVGRARSTRAPTISGWDVATISYGDLQWLAQGVAGHADDVVALDPPELVSAVVAGCKAAAGHERLRRPAAATARAGALPAGPPRRPGRRRRRRCSASPRSSCAATSTWSSSAACPDTVRAT